MYLEFLFRRAHSRSRVERIYWSGVSLNSFTTCSKDVTVGTTGPIGSGLPQFGFPRRFAISYILCPLFPALYNELGVLRDAADIAILATMSDIHSKAFTGKKQAFPSLFIEVQSPQPAVQEQAPIAPRHTQLRL